MKAYVIMAPAISITFCFYSFICAKVFQKHKSTIFQYLYANLLCDTASMLFGVVMSITKYLVLRNMTVETWFYMAIVFSISRMIALYSSFLSLAIKIQRYVFIQHQKYLVEKHTKKIIFLLGVVSFVTVIPFFLTLFVRQKLLIKMRNNLKLKNASALYPVDFNSYLKRPGKKNVFDLIYHAYGLVHLGILVIMMIFCLLTVQKLIRHRREILRIYFVQFNHWESYNTKGKEKIFTS